MCLADPIAHVHVGARVCDVFAIYEQPRTSARGVRGKDVRLLTRVRDTRARACQLVPPYPSHAHKHAHEPVDPARGGGRGGKILWAAKLG